MKRKGKKRNTHKFWWGNLRRRHNMEDLNIDGAITLDGYYTNRKGGRKLN